MRSNREGENKENSQRFRPENVRFTDPCLLDFELQSVRKEEDYNSIHDASLLKLVVRVSVDYGDQINQKPSLQSSPFRLPRCLLKRLPTPLQMIRHDITHSRLNSYLFVEMALKNGNGNQYMQSSTNLSGEISAKILQPRIKPNCMVRPG